MYCQSCGAPLSTGSTFCAKCGRPASASARVPSAFNRPGVVTFLAVLNFAGAAMALVYTGLSGLVILGAKGQDVAPMLAVAVVFLVLALLQLATGIGLWGLRAWGRTLQIVLAIFGLLGIPCGTIASAFILYYMFKPGVRILFSERSPRQLTPEELALVTPLGESSALLVVLVGIVVALVGVALIGIMAAIAIPSLLRARVSANESAAIGDVRSIVSAEQSYASANGGFYDSLECLAAPGRCIPDYPAAGPVFLDSALASASTKSGYQRTFHPGPPAEPEILELGRVSRSSLKAWAYVAVPVNVGQTGVRAFCGDSTGRICFSTDGTPPPVEDGLCAAGCQDIR
jgi:type II secretory pathway pseudopilin PulG